MGLFLQIGSELQRVPGFLLDAGYRDVCTYLSVRKLERGWQGGGETDCSTPGFQIRKGVSASAVPFTPSSPLLSCSQEGSRHTVPSHPLCTRDRLNGVCAREVMGGCVAL